jgi:hypothetical protein
MEANTDVNLKEINAGEEHLKEITADLKIQISSLASRIDANQEKKKRKPVAER